MFKKQKLIFCATILNSTNHGFVICILNSVCIRLLLMRKSSRRSNPKRIHTTLNSWQPSYTYNSKYHQLIDVNTKNSSKDIFKIRKYAKSRV